MGGGEGAESQGMSWGEAEVEEEEEEKRRRHKRGNSIKRKRNINKLFFTPSQACTSYLGETAKINNAEMTKKKKKEAMKER